MLACEAWVDVNQGWDSKLACFDAQSVACDGRAARSALRAVRPYCARPASQASLRCSDSRPAAELAPFTSFTPLGQLRQARPRSACVLRHTRGRLPCASRRRRRDRPSRSADRARGCSTRIEFERMPTSARGARRPAEMISIRPSATTCPATPTLNSDMQSVHARAFLILWVSAWLSACSTPPSTPYAPVREGKGPFGYSTEALGEHQFRVEFWGSAKTPTRTAMAFALFRAAELADSLKVAAFRVESGPIDRSILDGNDVFSLDDPRVLKLASLETVRSGPPRRIQTATIFIPLYIETPEARDARTASKLVILRIRMNPASVESEDPRLFVTDEVLRRLRPRVLLGAPT